MANGKGSRRRPLTRCTDQELAAEWNRIFGRKARPANRRAIIAKLDAQGTKPKLGTLEWVEQQRAFRATQPDLGIDRQEREALEECGAVLEGDNVIEQPVPPGAYEVERKEIGGHFVTVLTAVDQLPPSSLAVTPAPTVEVARPKQQFRKYGRSK